MSTLTQLQYGIGIDLGTSNCAVGLWDPKEPSHTVPLVQLESPGHQVTQALLPSSLYISLDGELTPETGRLPWQTAFTGIVGGEFARKRGALLPERYIASSKSWLCCDAVDRTAPILPWESPVATKLSPVDCAKLFLEQLRESVVAFRPQALQEAEWVLTVPASFDEVARTLTVEAAQAVGLSITLLEEPQAAFYAWIAQQGDAWREQVAPGELVLVCDVGGGTFDCSLIAVGADHGDLRLDRIAVGPHLLLGGDNMDLALALSLQQELQSKGTRLDRWQLLALIQQARLAKEQLLGASPLDTITMSLASKGADLFASTVQVEIHRQQVVDVLLEGFFPRVAVTEKPAEAAKGGVYELGLRYETEPALTKHLAKFLHQAWENAQVHPEFAALIEAHPDGFFRPHKVLFNGGVFTSDTIRSRMVEVINSWSSHPVQVLDNPQLDLAVAIGAAYYAHSKATGEGVRIAAGTARSYYLGIETSRMAVPGWQPPLKALCILPQGTKAGDVQELPARTFGLVTGQPVTFRFFSAPRRAGDETGSWVEDAEAELEEGPALQSTLSPGDGYEKGALVPVTLQAHITEIGTLEVTLQQVQGSRRWNLAFNVQHQR